MFQRCLFLVVFMAASLVVSNCAPTVEQTETSTLPTSAVTSVWVATTAPTSTNTPRLLEQRSLQEVSGMTSIVCPNCGTDNLAGATTCCKCNTNLQHTQQAPDQFGGPELHRRQGEHTSQEELPRTKYLGWAVNGCAGLVVYGEPS
jgi:ribosomal protein L40E